MQAWQQALRFMKLQDKEKFNQRKNDMENQTEVLKVLKDFKSGDESALDFIFFKSTVALLVVCSL